MKLVEIMKRGKRVRVDTHDKRPSCGIKWDAGQRYIGTVSLIDPITGNHYQLQIGQLEWEYIRSSLDKAFAEAPG